MAKDDIQKKLRKENDELKLQIANLQEEFKKLSNKMASLPESQDLEQSVEFLSGEYETIRHDKSSLQRDLNQLSSKLNEISVKVYEIDETLESVIRYSYQYNLKLMGIPKANTDVETSDKTLEICLKIFTEMGVDISPLDIDIAHRIPSRNKQSSALPIICKFTRRAAKEAVVQKRNEISKVDLDKLGLPVESGNVMRIYDHLTPKQQDLFNSAKSFQRENGYQFCWVKNQKILLRESQDSRIIHVSSKDVLQRLAVSASTSNADYHNENQPWWSLSSHVNSSQTPLSIGPYRGGMASQRGRPRTRSSANFNKS